MSTWRNEYLSALQTRDSQEQATKAVYYACTLPFPLYPLLFSSPVPTPPRCPRPSKPVSAPTSTQLIPYPDTKLADRATSLSVPPPSSFSADKPPSKPGTPVPASAQARQDLLEAQRSRGELQTRLDTVTIDLERLKLRSKADTKWIGELTAERASLVKKLRDRDEELRGKAKLLEVSVCAAKRLYLRGCRGLMEWHTDT